MSEGQLVTVPAADLEYTKERIDLIKAQCAPGASDIELQFFLYQCKRLQLDPLLKQIHFIKRGRGENAKVTIQVGIDGYRLIADRTKLYAGCDEVQYTAKGGRLVKASVTVYKLVQGQRYAFVGTAIWDEFAAKNNDGSLQAMWAKMPFNQLAKCAEAQALRKAFPAELAGTYIPEEMDQAERDQPNETYSIPVKESGNGSANQISPAAREDSRSPQPQRDATPEPQQAGANSADVVDSRYVDDTAPVPVQQPEAKPATTPGAAAAPVEITPAIREAVAAFKRSAVTLDMPYKGLVEQDRAEWIARLLFGEGVVDIAGLTLLQWQQAREPLEAYLKATEGQPHLRGASLVREMCKSAIHKFPGSVYKLTRREWYALADAVRAMEAKHADATPGAAPEPKRANPRARFFAMCNEAGLWLDPTHAPAQRAWMSKILSERDKRTVEITTRTTLNDADWRYLSDALEHHSAHLLADAAQGDTLPEAPPE